MFFVLTAGLHVSKVRLIRRGSREINEVTQTMGVREVDKRNEPRVNPRAAGEKSTLCRRDRQRGCARDQAGLRNMRGIVRTRVKKEPGHVGLEKETATESKKWSK